MLNRPFPAIENAQLRLITIAFHGCFVAFFLLAFKPFELYRTAGIANTNSVVYVLGFALTVSLALLFSEFLIWKVIKIQVEKWTFGKAMLMGIWDMLLVTFAIFIYINYQSDFAQFTYQALFRISSLAILFSVIPVMITTVFLDNWWLRQNLGKASDLQNKVDKAVFKATDNRLRLQSENNHEFLNIDSNQLLFIESVDNYVSVYHLDQQQVKKQLLRSNLKKLESQIDAPSIVRCHRSFMVNLKNIKKVEGNSRGLQLYFSDYDTAVPVSRRYVKSILGQLESNQGNAQAD
ncbi:MAG: LytTR family DNA-binding domain-containing protein [Bacteroidota bacterium]